FNTVKTHFMRAVTGGLTAIKASSDTAAAFFQEARTLDGQAKEMGKMVKAADHSSDAAKAKVASMQTQAKANVADKHGKETGKLAKKTGRFGDTVAADASKHVKGASTLAKGSRSVLRGVPYAGTAMTVTSEAIDYGTGTDTAGEAAVDAGASLAGSAVGGAAVGDRKSTRLNSSHV